MKEHLGIKFPVTPKIYRVNRLTEAILRAKTDASQRNVRAFLANLKAGVSDAPVALDGTIIIFSPDRSYYTPYYRLHENGHAYHLQKDPKIVKIAKSSTELI